MASFLGSLLLFHRKYAQLTGWFINFGIRVEASIFQLSALSALFAL